MLSSSPSISKFISDHQPLLMLEKQCRSVRDLRQLHCQLIKTGLAADTIAASRLLAAASTSGDLLYAELLFAHTLNPNLFMYNTLIRAFSKSSTPQKSIYLFHDMLSSSLQPMRLTFPSVFTAYANLGLSHEGTQVHAMVLKLNLAGDPYIRNSMVSMYAAAGFMDATWQIFSECSDFDVVTWNSMITGFAKVGRIEESKMLFDEMPHRNDVTWSSMISGYVRNGRNLEAINLFHDLQELGLQPTMHILVSLLGACSCLGAIEQGEWIHSYIEHNNIYMNPIVSTAIIDMQWKCGNIHKALQVFDNAKTKGLSSWNSIINGLAYHGLFEEALRYFTRLCKTPLLPDHVTFLSVLTCCSHSGMVHEALKYFSLMVDFYGIEPRIEHYGCMVDVLGRAGFVLEAKKLIDQMPVQVDTKIWASLLSSCKIYGNTKIGEVAARKIFELDSRDSSGYVLLSNIYSSAGEFDDAVSTRVVMEEMGVEKVPGCSLIEVEGLSFEFIAGGIVHPQTREIYQVLHDILLNIKEEKEIEGWLECVEYQNLYGSTCY